MKLKSGTNIKVRECKLSGEYPIYGGNGINGTYNEYNVEPNTIIIGRVGFYCGSVNITESKAWVTDNALIVSSIGVFEPRFLLYLLQYMDLGKTSNSTAQPVVSGKGILPLLIPLPPLNEQKRIVAKIEELLPLVDEYSKAQEALDKLNAKLPDDLRKSILQQAIEGKLVPQDSNDEPASELLKRINPKISAPCDNPHYENDPFEIPKSWVWVRLSELGFMERGHGIKRNETSKKGLPCLRYGEIYTSYIYKFSYVKSYISQDLFNQCNKISNGDLVFTLTGENKIDIAKTIAYHGTEDVAIGGDLAKWTCHCCDADFLSYMMYSNFLINQKKNNATGDIIVHISVSKVGDFLFPLPPLKEQKRIVSKIETLFETLDTIKSLIN